jgi:hypothetical protein
MLSSWRSLTPRRLRLEGATWIAVAIGLLFFVRPVTRRQKWSTFAASFGFGLFGITDFLEAPLQGQLPAWLWVFKIVSAAWILACRFWYVGWDRFRFTDRYFLFGLGGLLAALAVLGLQRILYGTESLMRELIVTICASFADERRPQEPARATDSPPWRAPVCGPLRVAPSRLCCAQAIFAPL